jgi:hypothetical protein
MSNTLSKETLIDHHVLSFDPGDRLNGSLYLGSPTVGGTFDVSAAISALRAAALWSAAAPKTVAAEQKQAYKDQLQLVEAVAYADGFILARFDHPKFPSDATRWGEWVAFFDARHARTAA